MKAIITISALMILFVSSNIEAKRECYEKHPEFRVNEKVIWDGTYSADELFERFSKKEIPNSKKINKEGIWLADLVRKHADKGTLMIKSCGKNAFTVDVDELLSKDKNKSGYYLALTKKKIFKIVHANGVIKAQASLKRVSSIHLLTKLSK